MNKKIVFLVLAGCAISSHTAYGMRARQARLNAIEKLIKANKIDAAEKMAKNWRPSRTKNMALQKIAEARAGGTVRAELEPQIQRLAQKRRQLGQRIQQLQGLLTTRRTQINDLREELRNLGSDPAYVSQSAAIARLEARLDAAETDRINAGESLNTTIREQQDIARRMRGQTNDIIVRALENRATDLARKVTKLTQDQSEAQGRINAINEELAQIQTEAEEEWEEESGVSSEEEEEEELEVIALPGTVPPAPPAPGTVPSAPAAGYPADLPDPAVNILKNLLGGTELGTPEDDVLTIKDRLTARLNDVPADQRTGLQDQIDGLNLGGTDMPSIITFAVNAQGINTNITNAIPVQ